MNPSPTTGPVTSFSWAPERWDQGLVLAAISGGLLLLAWVNPLWPGYHVWNGWLAWIGFVPFLWAWQKTGPRRAFVLGLFAGLIYFLGISAWLKLVNRNTNLDNAIAWAFFSVCGGIYWGVFASASRWVVDRLRLRAWWVLPVAWTAIEYLRGHLFAGGWPWGSLGHTQYANAVVRQWSAVVGVNGISCLIMAVNAGLAFEVVPRWVKGLRPPSRPVMGKWERNGVWALGILWVLLTAVMVFQAIEFARLPKGSIKLALLQANIDTFQRWDETYKQNALENLESLHQQAVAQHPDLIIGAESCFPGVFGQDLDADWIARLRKLVRQGNTATLVTANELEPTFQLEGKPYHHYNSAFLLGPDGTTAGRYRKIRIVPFGEYIPYRYLERVLHAVVREPIPMDFEPGTEYTPLQWRGVKFSPLICYESHYEELGAQLAKSGARFFTAMSNVGWAGRSAMSWQSASMAVFLAVENRAPVAMATMTGPTGAIDAWGNWSESLPLFQSGVSVQTLRTADYTTFFTRWGNAVPLLLTALFTGLWVWAFFSPRSFALSGT